MLTKDFKEFIELFNKHDVRYLVVGGYAVAIHGHPRYTKDIDIWVQSDESNGKRIAAALSDFGFGSLGLTPHDFSRPGYVIQLGHPPNRIDIITSLLEVSFDECYASRTRTVVDGVEVSFISLSQLLRCKRATGRPQDLADVQRLTELGAGGGAGGAPATPA